MNEDHWIECEKGLLGKAIESPEVRAALNPGWFSHATHVAVAQAILDLHKEYPSGRLTDGVRLGQLHAAINESGAESTWFMSAVDLSFLGAGDWRNDLLKPVLAHTKLERLKSLAFTVGDPNRFGDTAEDVESRLLEALHEAQALTFATKQTIRETVVELVNEWEEEATGRKQRGLRTGIMSIDSLLWNGMTPGSVHIIAARPSIGKTSLALQIALNIALAGTKVLFVSLEMDQREMVLRCLCNLSEVPAQDLESGSLVEWQARAVEAATGRICNLPMTFATENCGTLFEIESLVSGNDSPQIVFIDYLGLLATGGKARSRYEEVTNLSVSMKRIARRTKVPFVVLAQLNRDTERQGRKPVLSDLRDSGSIEQDADTVTFLHRDDDDPEDHLQVRISKNRNGPTGKGRLRFDKQIFKLTDITAHAPEP